MNKLYSKFLFYLIVILILVTSALLYGRSESDEDCEEDDSQCLLEKANDAWMDHDFETAIEALTKYIPSIEIEEVSDSIFICQAYHNLANCEKDYFEESRDPIHLENALNYMAKHFNLIYIDSTFINISESYGDLAEIYLLFAEIRNPESYLDSALDAGLMSLKSYPLDFSGPIDYRLFMNVIEAASKLAFYLDRDENLKIVDEYIDSLLKRQEYYNEIFYTPISDKDQKVNGYWNYVINEFIALTYERLADLEQTEYYLRRALKHIKIACDGYKASEWLKGPDNCEPILKRLKAKLSRN